MDILKKFFPFSFSVQKKETNSLIASIVIYAIGIIALSLFGWLFGWILGNIPVLPWLVGLLTSLLDTYCTAGIVFAILKFVGVFK